MQGLGYNIHENIFTLTSFNLRHEWNQTEIEKDTLWGKYVPSKDVLQAIKENKETDNELWERFTNRNWEPEQPMELHTNACINRGIQECSCMPDKGTGEAVLL